MWGGTGKRRDRHSRELGEEKVTTEKGGGEIIRKFTYLVEKIRWATPAGKRHRAFTKKMAILFNRYVRKKKSVDAKTRGRR